METIVILFGLGLIGLSTIKYLCEKGGFEIIGAVDVDPKKLERV